jgi:hypothetical protein
MLVCFPLVSLFPQNKMTLNNAIDNFAKEFVSRFPKGQALVTDTGLGKTARSYPYRIAAVRWAARPLKNARREKDRTRQVRILYMA